MGGTMTTHDAHAHLVEMIRLRMADDDLTTNEAARRAGIHRCLLYTSPSPRD